VLAAGSAFYGVAYFRCSRPFCGSVRLGFKPTCFAFLESVTTSFPSPLANSRQTNDLQFILDN